MTVPVLAFYLFALVTVVSGLLVTLARNPVHSVLWLILTFVSSAGLFVLLGAEFIALLLIIVYVGAVAVLFLFVVMMLDVDFAQLRGGLAHYLPMGLLVAVVLLVELGLLYGQWAFAPGAAGARQAVMPAMAQTQNTVALGDLIYTQYIYLFQTAGLILLVAMIGAIVLTMRHRPDVKRQNVVSQMHRDPAKEMELKNVKPGQGL